MTNQTDILEEFLRRLIISPAQESTLNALVSLFERVITDKQCLPNLDIPYDDITSFIYEFHQEINLKDLDSMMEELENKFSFNYPIEINTGRKHDKHLCFSKFRTHIFLAATQKNYITKVAQDLSKQANQVATEADKTATDAKDQAEKARKTYDDMMVNYITILGIFASIIITIFGGMQIISATTGLLQANISLATLILVLSFLTMLIILILAILLNWISNLKESKRSNFFVYGALILTLTSMVGAGTYMFKYKKENPAKLNSKVLMNDDNKDTK
ncbi:hypothetical protein [Acinetobacter haemolyticus]|uniref:hypothetical protein n=1 Tax=Acinetobacter haemolyticus TaxID=29430 RepID=UPI0021CD4FF6|nr:hypothetical protein [Acinetobacter haemolyticus]MCU4377624.1 hypothetical protein [Acinetobacter haemolyticus]